MLRVESVSKRFGGVVALDGVSVEVDKGELMGLIGPNGSGKTTLFNVVTGHVKPDNGRVVFDGMDITRKPVHLRVKIGIARSFQQPKYFPSLTVRDNLRVATRDEGLIEEALKVVGLSGKSSVPAAKLTLHEIRRLELARCLALRPKLVLLDEPMAGLAMREAAELGELIKSLNSTMGLTYVIVEHRLSSLFKVVERVVVMNAGRKIAEGTPEDVVRNPLVKQAYLGRS